MPSVQILDMPNHSDRFIAIVKVSESIEAPHAIENSMRVYVRVASTTEPYELADINRIEHLLKRRQEPERRREYVIQRMAKRSICKDQAPRVRVVVAPVFPRGTLIPMDELIERAETLQKVGDRYLRQFRLLHNGILSSGMAHSEQQWHLEVDTHGIVFFEEPSRPSGRLPSFSDDTLIPYVNTRSLVTPPAAILNIALSILKGAMTNVLIRYELFGWNGICFVPENPANLWDPGEAAQDRECLEPHLKVECVAVLETLVERRANVVSDLTRQLLPAFNYSPHQDPQEMITTALREAKLI